MISGIAVDVSEQEIADMLSVIDPDCDHEKWVKIGMAIHDATNGTGLDLWNEWSSRGEKYPTFGQIEKRWHSFGKAGNPYWSWYAHSLCPRIWLPRKRDIRANC